ncbi:hypothetical protein, partial [Streptomyces phytophilus]|uniref:hypothetical protein n=1 Tax=Streptomyces phytophilus TaxID=722715 RepID=UPI001C68F8E0
AGDVGAQGVELAGPADEPVGGGLFRHAGERNSPSVKGGSRDGTWPNAGTKITASDQPPGGPPPAPVRV